MTKEKKIEEDELEEETEEKEVNEEVEEEIEEVKGKKGKGKKAPPRRRKAKREKESPIRKAIRLVVESGKVSFGYNKSLKNIKEGKPKLVIVSDNIPSERYIEIEYFASELKVPVYKFEGNAKELAGICGKPFLVSVLSIYEEGSSNILELILK